MPAFGGASPYPRRCGGGVSRIATLSDAFAAAIGDAYSKQDSSLVVARNRAIARMLNAAWSTNERLGNSADPYRMHVSMLDRWDNALAVPLISDVSEVSRRDALSLRFERVGKAPNQNRLRDEITAALGDVLVDIYYVPFEYARVRVPDTSYPFGGVSESPHGVFGVSAPWYSTTAHVLVLVDKPQAMTESQLLDTLAAMVQRVDAVLPSWATLSWYRAPEAGAPIDVPLGPQNTGMYLDERNLNNSVFAPFPHPGTPGFFLDVEKNLNRLKFS